MAARILIIEDHKANLELMRFLLRAHGYRVICASDGQTGLDLIRSEGPDAVVCDIQMPELDGLEVAQILKADPDLRDLPLVAVTALAMVGDRERIMAAGFDGYISKPIEAEEFVGRVESYLRAELRSGVVHPPVESGEHPRSAATPTPGGATVLVVDDTPANLDLIRETLRPFGFNAISARNGSRAMELLKDLRPDLILSDLHLAGEPDFEFLDRVKRDPRLANIPVVMLSSTSLKQDLVTTGRSKGAARFLFRPIEPSALIAEVRSCLEDSP